MAMYSGTTIENFNMIKQIIQEKEEKMLKLYPYLSQNKTMSQEEHENKAIEIMELIKDQIYQQLPNGKLNEMSPQETIQEGLRFINLVNEIYILGQQEKKILHEEDKSIQQLKQAEEQLQQATKQLRQAEEQLQQAKKQLEPTQEKLKLMNKQKNLFIDVLNSNKEIVLQKLIAE